MRKALATDPGEARMTLAELQAKAPPEPEKTPPPDRVRGVAHLADGVLTNLNHSIRHMTALKAVTGDPERLQYNIDHLENHLAESADHARRLVAALYAYYPAIGAELDKLHEVTQQGQVSPARSAPGDYDVTESRSGPEPA